MAYLRRFGAFWYDFLVGDRSELFVGPLVALVVTGLALRAGLPAIWTSLLLVGCVVLVGGISLVLAVRGR